MLNIISSHENENSEINEIPLPIHKKNTIKKTDMPKVGKAVKK